MKEPTKPDLFDELVGLRAENARLKRELAAGNPSRDLIQEIACALRDAAFSFEQKAAYFGELQAKAYALVPDHLPTTEEMSGLLSKGRARVYAALKEPNEVSRDER